MHLNAPGYFFLCLLLFPLDLWSETSNEIDDLLNMSIEELLQVVINVSSREPTTLLRAPNIVTRWSAEDIHNERLTSLRQLYQRSPGMTIINEAWDNLITFRGLIQDQNLNHLILLDGHNMNHAGWRGIGPRINFPSIHNLKALEILRGPGSTLWGADANLSTTYMESYNGADLDTGNSSLGALTFSSDYEFEEQQFSNYLLYGKKINDKADIMASLSHIESDGHAYPVYKAGPSGPVLREDRSDTKAIIPASYELYSKINLSDLSLRFYKLDYNQRHGGRTFITGNGITDWHWGHSFIDIRYNPQISEHFFLENKVAYDDFDTFFRNIRPSTDPGANAIVASARGREKSSYETWTVESILKHKIENNTLSAGVTWVLRDYPGNFFRTDLGETQTHPSNKEETYSLLIENTFTQIDDWVGTLGVRWDKREVRVDGEYLYPRLSVVYAPAAPWSAKYSYNTGVTLPNFTQTWNIEREGLFIIGADDPQSTRSHDFQVNHTRRNTTFSTTFFYMDVKDIITNFGFDTVIDGVPTQFAHNNAGVIVSKGIELEIKHSFTESLMLEANYMYADTKYDNNLVTTGGVVTLDLNAIGLVSEKGRLKAAPGRVWNIILNYKPHPSLNINLHHRGWDDAIELRTSGNFKTKGPETFTDITLSWKYHDFQVGTYLRNIFDNDVPDITQNNSGGFTERAGRLYGMTVGYTF